MRKNPEQPGWMQYGIRMQQLHPEVVTDSYLHSMMMAGIVAAHETTANATANAVKLLLQHPKVWQEICADPSLIPNAVEECLRHNGSVAAWRRLATRDVVIGGVAVPAGSKLLIVTSSANHDERHFADADFFDIRRENMTTTDPDPTHICGTAGGRCSIQAGELRTQGIELEAKTEPLRGLTLVAASALAVLSLGSSISQPE
mgnify:CR=1 FL=1